MPSASPPSFPLRSVAALFIARQHLDRPRKSRLSDRRLSAFVADSGGIQIDSINVIERAHYLTVWSRFGTYDRRALDRLIYEERMLFEYWAHAACLVRTADFRFWRRAMLDYSRKSRGWGSWLEQNRKLLRAVEAEIAARGPLGNADFEHDGKPRSGGWWSWKPATHALDYLWMSGRTLIHSRSHFQKRFELAERVMPEPLKAEPASAEEFRKWHLERALHAMGAATAADLRMYFTFPRTEMTERRRLLSELLRSGEVVEIAIERGVESARREKPWYALAEDLPGLREAAEAAMPAGTTLLTPFDSFLWHRERTERLFGFNYRIEVYTPGHKRIHGYYVLPVFHDGQLIGRIDAKNHRQARTLEIKHAHFEPWFVRGDAPPAASWGPLDRDRALAGIADAVSSLARFLDAERTELARVSPAKLAAPLRRAIRSAALGAAEPV